MDGFSADLLPPWLHRQPASQGPTGGSPLAHTNSVWLPTGSTRGAKAKRGSAEPRWYGTRRPSASCTPKSYVKVPSAAKLEAEATKVVLSVGPLLGLTARQVPPGAVQAGRRAMATETEAEADLPSAGKGG